VRVPLLVAAVVAVVAVGGSACGSSAVGDCSDGTFDGQGGCIPNSHAPRLVEAAAIRHFRGQTVDRVGCYVEREFVHHAAHIKVWGCWRVVGGILTHDLACVPASHGRPLSAAARATIPAKQLRCSA
jgi:hypothetical protein